MLGFCIFIIVITVLAMGLGLISWIRESDNGMLMASALAGVGTIAGACLAIAVLVGP